MIFSGIRVHTGQTDELCAGAGAENELLIWFEGKFTWLKWTAALDHWVEWKEGTSIQQSLMSYILEEPSGREGS